MKSIYIFLIICVGVFVSLNSCHREPNTKTDYLSQFNAFVATVSEEYRDYSEETWVKKDKAYKDFTDKWYLKFKDSLDITEKITVKKLAIRYQIFRNGNDLEGGIEEGLKALKEIGKDFLQMLETDSSGKHKHVEIDFK